MNKTPKSTKGIKYREEEVNFFFLQGYMYRKSKMSMKKYRTGK